jgi:hypothetical protein
VHPHCCAAAAVHMSKKRSSKMTSCNRVNKANKTHRTLLGSTIPQHADAQGKACTICPAPKHVKVAFPSCCTRVAPAMGTWV